jgi:hypothetical protein
MQLATGGSDRNQDEKIVLLFSARTNFFRAGLATPGKTDVSLQTTQSPVAQPELCASAACAVNAYCMTDADCLHNWSAPETCSNAAGY